MSSNDRALSMMVALGLVLVTACGGEATDPGDLQPEDIEAANLQADALQADGVGTQTAGGDSVANDGVANDGLANDGAANAGALVEKQNAVLSGAPSFLDFGIAGFGESRSQIWVISATRRVELVTAVSVEPFTVSPIGCAVIEPTDPSLRRCVFTITFSPPGEAGRYEATIGASDLDGNLTTVDVVGVGEAFLP